MYVPDVLLIIVVLGDNSDFIRNEINWVEAYTKLANKTNIGALWERLQELFGSCSTFYQ